MVTSRGPPRLRRMLESTRVLHAGRRALVIRKPSAEAIAVNAAKISNVADAIRMKLKAEFPGFATQALFRCMQLDSTGTSPERVVALRHLLRSMQKSAAWETTCVAQYIECYPVALKWKKEASPVSSATYRNAWAYVATSRPQNMELVGFVRFVLAFLLTETECERNFAEERRAYSGRPRLLAGAREAGLKCMLDGLPLARLVDERTATPIGSFLSRIQNRYVSMFGAKRMGTVRQRRDAGKPLARRRAKPRNGKDTVTTFRANRAALVHSTAQKVLLPFGRTVFGCAAGSREQRTAKAQELQTAAFKALHRKSNEKYNTRRELCEQVAARDPGVRRLAEPTEAAKKRAQQKRKAALELASQPRWAPGRLTAAQWVKRLQGQPWFWVADGVVLPNGGLGEMYYADLPLAHFTSRGSLQQYVRDTKEPTRRIMIVPDLGAVSTNVVLAAILLGARVQSCIYTPGLHYEALGKHTFAFTVNFKRSKRGTVQIIQEACERPCPSLQRARAVDSLSSLCCCRQRVVRSHVEPPIPPLLPTGPRPAAGTPEEP